MIKVFLFSTVGCHLCEDALDLLNPYVDKGRVLVEEVDIADSDELMALYGVSIPVLKRSDNGQSLYWPFGSIDLDGFLS